MEITSLLVGLAVGVGATLVYRQLKSSKKAYFKNQLKLAEKEIWEKEFAKFSTMVAYENQRQLYSQGQDHLNQLNEKLSQDKNNKELKKQVADFEKRLHELEQGLKEYDMILNGAPASEEYPQGMRGLTETLEGIAKKRQNIADFIRLNC